MTKLKRQKHVKKSLAFYRNYFDFEGPYQILIDGTFCKEALKFKVNISEQLPKYLDSQVELLTTPCAKAECHLFGNTYDLPLYGAKIVINGFKVEDCGHKKPVSPSSCLLRMAKHRKKFFIATQEKALTEKLRSVPGTPVLYIAFNAITLEAPSEASRSVEKDRLKCLGITEQEKNTIKLLKSETFGEETKETKKRKKKKKGQNPLSCKKKKVKPSAVSQEHDKKKRKRGTRKHKPNSHLTVVQQSMFKS